MNSVLLYLMLLAAAALTHLLEEVLTGFRTRLPVGEMPCPVFIGINVLIYSYAGLTFWFLLKAMPAGRIMAWIFAAGMLVNGLGHLGYMVYKRAYFPGGVTAAPLCAAGVLLIRAVLLN